MNLLKISKETIPEMPLSMGTLEKLDSICFDKTLVQLQHRGVDDRIGNTDKRMGVSQNDTMIPVINKDP